ncbi:DUF6603 domain-containing protein [Elizabethkingia anophelis]|uniref:DUF6603 domain-containing protein n=1 Tax=Elizabethkingia anophelis TaxID=1117645 RepID=UPI003892A446
MNLTEIINKLQNDAKKNKKIIIDAGLFKQDVVFSNLVKYILRREEGNIILDVSSIPDIVNNAVFFNAGLPDNINDSFLFLTGNKVSVKFEEINNTVSLILSIELKSKYAGGIKKWEFGDSFSELKNKLINDLPLSDEILTFKYNDAVQNPDKTLDFIANYKFEGILSVYKNIIQSLGGNINVGKLHGKIFPSNNKMECRFEGAASTSEVDLKKLKVKGFNLVVSQMWIENYYEQLNPYSDKYYPRMEISLKGLTELDGMKEPVDTYLYTIPGNYTPYRIGIIVVPQEKGENTLFSNLATWMSGNSMDAIQLIKDKPFGDFFDYVGLKHFSFEFDLKSRSFLSLLRLKVGTTKPWKISEHFTVSDITLDWLLFDPLTKPFSTVEVSGELKIIVGDNELTFFGKIGLPDLNMSMKLHTDQNLTIVQWLNIIIGAFGNKVPLKSYIESSLEGFELRSMGLDYDYRANRGVFTLLSSILVGDKNIGFEIYLDVNFKNGDYDIKVAFLLDNIRIKGEITNSKIRGKTIIFCDVDLSDAMLGLNYLPSLLGYNTLGIPSGLDLGLNKAGIIYDFSDKSFALGAHSFNYGSADLVVFKPKDHIENTFFAGFYIDKTIDITRLPLIGKILSSLHKLQIDKMEMFITSRHLEINEAQKPIDQYVSVLEKELNGTFPVFPLNGMSSSIGISFDINIGGYIIPVSAGIGGTANTGIIANSTGMLHPAKGDLSKPIIASPPDQSDGTFWINIQKSIGFLYFRRLGIKYENGKLWFSLDCSLNAGYLKIDLMEGSIGTSLSDFHPEFRILGLGIEFKGPGMDIGGALFKSPSPEPNVDWEYAGGAVIRIMNYSLSAWGSYANIYTNPEHTATTPSMFLFAQFNGTLGGAPFFVLTGLSGGFGYNSRLRLPQIKEVHEFPFVTSAFPSKLKNTTVSSYDQSPAQVLRNLYGLNGGKPWLTHEAGQYWLAFGIAFKSFELITTNALLVAEFGNSLQLMLIGLSKGRFPTVGHAYAFIELQIEVGVDFEKGSAQLSAQLSQNSYLIDPHCRITGMFAAIVWFDPSPYAGDFVFVSGRYNPKFQPPDHYPNPTSLIGISWTPDNCTTITGGSYFALTPSSIMAGGMLDIHYNSGPFSAWLKTWTDLLMYWHPFHFDVQIGVTVGASYHVGWGFLSFTVSGEFGLNLNLYGPPTGGVFTVHIWKYQIDVYIGAAKAKVTALTWAAFKERLLPSEQDLLKFIPKEGIIAKNDANVKTSTDAMYVRVSGGHFQLITAVPCSVLMTDYYTTLATREKIHIRPLANHDSYNFKCNLTIFDQFGKKVTNQWNIDPHCQNVPKALWGKYQQGIDSGNDQLVKNQLVGYNIETPHKESVIIGIYDTKFNNYLDVVTDDLPLRYVPPFQADAYTSDACVSIIEHELSSVNVKSNRARLFSDLQELIMLNTDNEAMDAYAKEASALLRSSPLLS